MPNIDWYGPEYGKGGTMEKVAYTLPVAKAVRSKANAIAHRAAFLLDSRAHQRRQDKAGSAEIHVSHWPNPVAANSHGTTGANIDSLVYMTDPENKRGAKSIEEGHNIVDHEGNVVGFQPGLHVLKDAIH